MTKDQNIELEMLNELVADENSSGKQFDVFRLKHVFRKSRIVLIILLILSIATGYIYLRYTHNVYESNARLKINFKSESGILGIQANSNTPAQKVSSLQGEIEIIRSSFILDKVIEKLDFDLSYHVEGQILTEEKYGTSPFEIVYDRKSASIPYDQKINFLIIDKFNFETFLEGGAKVHGKFGEEVSLNGFKFIANRTDLFNESTKEHHFYFNINSIKTLKSYLASNLSVKIENTQANTVLISFKDHNRFKARDIVNKYVEVYLDETLEKKKESHRKTLEYINGQINKTKAQLDRADQLLRDFVQTSSTFDAKSEFPRLREKRNQLEDQLIKEEASLNQLQNLFTSLDNSDSLGVFISSVRNYEDPELMKLTTDLDKLYTEFQTFKLSSKPNTFAYQKKEVEILHLKNNILQYLINEKNSISNKVLSIKENIAKVKRETLGIPARDSEQHKLERDYNLYEKFYTLFYTKRIEYEIMKAGTIQQFDILSGASLSKSAVYPLKFKVYGIAIAVWFMLSIGWMVIMYVTQNKIVNQAELERGLTTPLLGSIPRYNKIKMEVSQLIVGLHPKSIISEAFRSIRTNLEFIIPKKATRLISVTSTISGEGKTFVALNLGGVIAMSGKKVVILDLDMRKPKIHLGFGGENNDGMSNVLIGNSKYQDCIKKSEINGLDYITAGPIPPNPSELLLRPEFDQLLDQLRKDYDVIMLDTPPVGLVTDGLIILRKADAALYVIRSEYSRKGVEKSINKLKTFNNIDNLSVILNSVPRYSGSQYGYGGYGYGYGYGYYDDDKPRSRNVFKKIFRKK